MKEITEERKDGNLSIFIEKLKQFGLDTKLVTETVQGLLRNATFAINAETNMAYDGSMIEIVLRQLTPMAIKLNNDLLTESSRVDKDSLVKVCLCQHLSKALMFEKNTNQWEIEKRGMLYKFHPSSTSLKMGLKSFLMALGMGIKFTEEELEAMTILDKGDDDEQAKYHSNPISYIVKIANELVFVNNKFSNTENKTETEQ